MNKDQEKEIEKQHISSYYDIETFLNDDTNLVFFIKADESADGDLGEFNMVRLKTKDQDHITKYIYNLINTGKTFKIFKMSELEYKMDIVLQSKSKRNPSLTEREVKIPKRNS